MTAGKTQVENAAGLRSKGTLTAPPRPARPGALAPCTARPERAPARLPLWATPDGEALPGLLGSERPPPGRPADQQASKRLF